jgi:hypothetical protein
MLYSPTIPGDKPKWKIIPKSSDAAPVKALITETEVCLFLTHFCMFVAVEQIVETKFVEAAVYGRYLRNDIVKLTLVLTAGQPCSQVSTIVC